MNTHELKTNLISQILEIEDSDFLLKLQDRISKYLNPKTEYLTTLAQILDYPTKDTGPTFVKLIKQEKEVKSWKELYTTVIIWVIDMHTLKQLNLPISDHYQGSKYAVAKKPEHSNGKHFHSEVKHRDLYIEGHGNTEHHLKTLQFIFNQFQLNSKDLEIRFSGPSGTGRTAKVTFD